MDAAMYVNESLNLALGQQAEYNNGQTVSVYSKMHERLRKLVNSCTREDRTEWTESSSSQGDERH